jgi:hypothetical protein
MTHHHRCHGCGHVEKLVCSRRELLGRLGGGIAGLAFADLLNRDRVAAFQAPKNPLAPKTPPLVARARSVISIFCYGGVSHIDTWDPKPDLVKWQGETMQGVGEIRTVMGNPGGLMPSPWAFRNTDSAGWKCQSSSLTWQSTWTTSRWSARCTESVRRMVQRFSR